VLKAVLCNWRAVVDFRHFELRMEMVLLNVVAAIFMSTASNSAMLLSLK